MHPLLVLRVGYMEKYDGVGAITSGGAYIRQNGIGGEIFNFKPSKGKCFGYAMSRNHAGINLRSIQNGSWSVGDELAGVDVVFIARRRGYGQVVVGWYRGATVFHKQYRARRGQVPGIEGADGKYLCVVNVDGATLLAEERRIFEVPSAQQGNPGFPGQSNVWYPEAQGNNGEVQKFMRTLRKFMEEEEEGALPSDEPLGKKKVGGRVSKPDSAHNTRVEGAAVDSATAYYEAQGYTVISVEEDCLGWDLEARKGKSFLRIEVKGMSRDTLNFELTPNEYAKLKAFSGDYKVFAVLNALDDPTLFELTPANVEGQWFLVSKEEGVQIKLKEKIAAVAVDNGEEVITI